MEERGMGRDGSTDAEARTAVLPRRTHTHTHVRTHAPAQRGRAGETERSSACERERGVEGSAKENETCREEVDRGR